MNVVRPLFLASLLLSLTGCPTGSRAFVPGVAVTKPAPGNIASLVRGGAQSAEDVQLSDLMNRATNVPFPMRLGVLMIDYDDPLKAEDQQVAVDTLGGELVKSGMVRAISQIPNSLVNRGEGIEAIRTLAARFQVDVVLMVSGSNQATTTAEQTESWFNFSNASTYESRATLSGLALGVYSGTFLAPFQVVGKAGPITVDPADPGASAQIYALRKQAQLYALDALKGQFLMGLTQLKATQDAATPAPSPSPTPTPASSPSPTPTPSASPST